MELGFQEIVLILLVALLVYGGKLPQVAAAVGRSLGELKRGLRDTTDLVKDDLDQLADLDPRRSARRAWKAPRVTGDDRAGPNPGDAASLPGPGEQAPPELAQEDISQEPPSGGPQSAASADR
jgi:TatA/E family protein of Tat protein translocase